MAPQEPIEIDADLRNADWPKRTNDAVDGLTGEYDRGYVPSYRREGLEQANPFHDPA